MRTRFNALLALASAAILAPVTWAPSALAQVAPPPSSKPRPVRDYTPPPAPTPPPRVNRPEPARPAARRPAALPNLPFKSLVQRNEDGSLIRLTTSPTIEALWVNPMIDEDLHPAIQDVLDSRRSLFRELVVTNIDDAIALDEGVLEKLRVNNRDELQEILGVVERLSTTTPEQELEQLGVIPDQAGAFTRKIATEYLQALQNELLDGFDPGDDTTFTPQDVIVQMMFTQHLQEAMDAYNDLASSLPEFVADGGLGGMDLAPEQRSALKPLVAELDGADTNRRRALTGQIVRELDTAQRQELLDGMYRDKIKE